MTASSPIEAEILAAARRRGPARSLCPSEVARALAPDDWRALMPEVRAAAARLAAAGVIRVTQRGVTVAVETARGPIRLSLAPPTSPAPRS